MHIWDLAQRRITSTFSHEGNGEDQAINYLEYSADGHCLMTSAGNSLFVWGLDDANLLAQLPALNLTSAALSHTGSHVVTSTEERADVWEVATGTIAASCREHTAPVEHAALSPDGTRLVSASADGTCILWNVERDQKIANFCGHAASVNWAAFRPDSAEIATIADDRTVRIWDAGIAAQSPVTLDDSGDLVRGPFSQDGQLVLAYSESEARVWDTVTCRLVASASQPESRILHSVINKDRLIVLERVDANTVQAWHDHPDWPHCDAISLPHEITYATLSQDASAIITASADNRVRAWDLAGNELDEVPVSNRVSEAAISSDGDRLIILLPNSAYIWDRNSQRTVGSIEFRSGSDFAAISSDGDHLFVRSVDEAMQVWDTRTRARTSIQDLHAATPTSVTISNDHSRILSVADDDMARIWETATGRELMILEEDAWLRHIVISQDDKNVLTLGASVRLWHGTPYRDRFPRIDAARRADHRIRDLIRDRLESGETLVQIRRAVAADTSLSMAERTAYLSVTCRMQTGNWK